MKALEDIIDLDRLPQLLESVDYRGDNGCWNWTRGKKTGGYGEFKPFRYGNNRATHAIFYEMRYDAIPKGMTVDHLCRNPSCVNPKHLEVVTRAANVMRGESPAAKNARKTHCGTCGNEFDYFYLRNGNPRRGCKNCTKLRMRASRARKKSQ